MYDCLTWEVRYTYSADLVKKEYKIFPEILDGAEGDAQRQVFMLTRSPLKVLSFSTILWRIPEY